TLAREQRDEPRPFFTNRDWWRRASFGVGWVLFLLFGGLQLLAVTGIVFVPVYPFTAPLALLGLGLMTLPVALRDLGRRALAD
ncbi:MAG: hypothetical protein KAI24_19115, partial [Planctomycetes bacterium]|nr:hypothetical protein [Planctomycetota bacterium]